MKTKWSLSLVSIIALLVTVFSPGLANTSVSGLEAVMQGEQAVNASPGATVTITLLHNNDFHGNLEPAGSNPGMARLAYKINEVRAEVGTENTLLLDAGDMMQGTLLSNLYYGESTVDVYNFVGYAATTFGNHEFDWAQNILISRTLQADFPYVTSNIVLDDTGDCATAGWTTPDWAQPWITRTVGTGEDVVTVGILAVTTQETPFITLAGNTAGLCFKEPTESISYHYDEVVAAGAEVLVVLSHLGFFDGGYGYGFDVYGDQTLAANLNEAGKPVDLIIGGHSHTDLYPLSDPDPTHTKIAVVGDTTVVQAHYAGRKLGRADITVDKATGDVSVVWDRIAVATDGPQDPDVLNRIALWADDPWYQEQINRVVGYTNVNIVRNYNGDSEMGKFINDAIYNDLNTDAVPENDVDMVFNNAGGLRADITFPMTGTLPYTLTHGILYSVLPFGNQTIVGDMTGAQIVELLNQSATLFKGALQIAGIRYSFYRYGDTAPGPYYAWGAYDIQVWDKGASAWEPLDLTHTYRIATNEFLAPAGQDGYIPFKYFTNYTYWGDMLDGVERWVTTAYPISTPYDETLDGRITRNGTDVYDPDDLTQIVPVNLLHHNDSHGRLSPAYAQLATLINQERAKNPDRTLLLSAGDNIQGDAMMYYFKSAFTGYAADGTPLPAGQQTHPLIAAFNAMDYDAMTLGNHEFNFGNYIFTGTLGQASFPILQANVVDDGQYGLDEVPVQDFITASVPVTAGRPDVDLAVLGIGNHRIPNYELPSNIPGLTFTNPITEALNQVPALEDANDAVVALTHIGFTTNPGSVEVDNNVDTYLAAQVAGIDAIIGGHSHTDPAKQTAASGDYKYLPAVLANPVGQPVIVTQANRYNTYLGDVALGLLPDGLGGYEVVARAGKFTPVSASTVEDPVIKAIVDPYVALLEEYNNRELGETQYPLDALEAFTQETNAANLQADAAVWELAQNGITVDFHISGAMTNRLVAEGATPVTPTMLTVSDMFTLMPYENSLVTMRMNGPQLKAILERGYRNYYYYKYVPGYGGYSYYTTCMLDINSVGKITYRDAYPMLPDGNNVLSLEANGVAVDFDDAATYYHVSTVNYLAAGSCNFNDGGVTLWPLGQIENDTQYYVRDAVIDYITDQEVIAPTIEGRLGFLTTKIHLPNVFQLYNAAE